MAVGTDVEGKRYGGMSLVLLVFCWGTFMDSLLVCSVFKVLVSCCCSHEIDCFIGYEMNLNLLDLYYPWTLLWI